MTGISVLGCSLRCRLERIRVLARVSVLFILASLLVACGKHSVPQENEIERTADFIAALEGTGATVAETAVLVPPVFGVPARVFQVNEAIVHVYEYESQEARIAASGGLATDEHVSDGKPSLWTDRASIWVSGRLIVVYPGTDKGMILKLSGLLGASISNPVGQVDEPYPPAVTAAIEYLAERLEVDPRDLEVIDFAQIVWPDTCLGLPRSGEDCVAALTAGWRVTVRVADKIHEVHTDQSGARLRTK